MENWKNSFIDKLVFIFKYLTEGRLLQIHDVYDQYAQLTLRKQFFTSLFSVLLLLLSLILFYYIVVRPLIRWLRSLRQKIDQGSLEPTTNFDKISIIVRVTTWVLIYLLIYAGSSLGGLYNNVLSQIIGDEPVVEESCRSFEPIELDECQTRWKEQRDQFKEHIASNPWIVLNEKDYRQLKSEFKMIECPSRRQVETDNFSDCEQKLTLQEKYRLKKSLAHWGILSLLLSLLFFLSRKLQLRLRLWLETKLGL